MRLILSAIRTTVVVSDFSLSGVRIMKAPSKFCYLVAALSIFGGTIIAQTEWAPARDGDDGSGLVQSCELDTYHGEYRDPEHEFRALLPDGVAGIVPQAPCRQDTGFKISLTHPDTGEAGGDLAWSMIWVGGSWRGPATFEKMVDGWIQEVKQDSGRIHATGLRLDQPEQTSLSTLPALDLKMTRTESGHGKLIYEQIVATSPEKNIVYVVGMVSPASSYEKNRRLFQAVVEGFTYVPSQHAGKR
jgi:hypothetical protein